MSIIEQIITISMIVIATMLTRFLPFMFFPADKETPAYIKYLGKVLPSAVFGMLIVYCLKNTSLFVPNYAIPEILGIAATIFLHIWKKNMLLSIAGGTFFYMALIQFVF